VSLWLPSFGVDVHVLRTPAHVEELRRIGSQGIILVDGHTVTDDLVLLVTRCRAGGTEVAVIGVATDPVSPALWVEAGASAVLTDDASTAELREAVDQLIKGKPVLGISVREGLLSKLRDKRLAESERLSPFGTLTRREAAVLRELAAGRTPEDIAQLSFVSLNTVRTQIRGILTKLSVNSVVAAVSIAYRSGWILNRSV
jgi:DNA-binding NarL/FixJ family response regulator